MKIDISNLGRPVGETKFVEKFGRAILEAVFSKEQERANRKYREIFEKMGITEDIVREQLTASSNTALFATAVAGFIEKAFRPELIASKIIKSIPLDLKGHDSIKIPKGVNLTASAIAANGTITFDDRNYGDKTITISWIGAGTKITHQLLSMAIVSLLEDKAEEIGFALQRKVDTDIATEIVKAGTKGDSVYGNNNNYLYLGAGNYITYDALTTAIANHEALYAKPKVILCHPQSKARILQDEDIKRALAFGTTPAGRILPKTVEIFDMSLISNPQITAGKIILVDTDRLGYFIDATPIQTWDGRVPSTVAFEIIGAKAYGVGITRPEAVYVIHENANEPSS